MADVDDTDSVVSSDKVSEDELCSYNKNDVEMKTKSSSGSEMEGTGSLPRRKSKSKDEKTCGVCGDKALGYNFNAITCESCKAFFRRNALKTMVCLFENKCVVDVRTRRFCPACRIQKCYSIGMNRDMILDESERKKRMTKVMANRAKRASTPEPGPPADIHIKNEIISPSELPEQTVSVTQYFRPATPYGKACGSGDETIFKHVPKDLLPTEPNMYYTLTNHESTLLNDIVHAYQNTLAAMPELGPHTEETGYQNTADLVNHSELVVRKLIMFVKHLEDFRLMTQDDQIASLKACIMNTLLLRSALFYSIEKDAWVTPKGEIPTSILKNATGFVSLHNSHVYYCRRIKSMAGNDLNIYSLLQVMIIFDPSGYNITSREFVGSIQDRYFILLKHYLESCFSYQFAKEYYVSVMDRLCDLKLLSQDHAKLLMQVNPMDVEPLMLEVLNLK